MYPQRITEFYPHQKHAFARLRALERCCDHNESTDNDEIEAITSSSSTTDKNGDSGAILTLRFGQGKTLIILALIAEAVRAIEESHDALYNSYARSPTLVVVTSALMHDWQEEMQKHFNPTFTVVTVTSTTTRLTDAASQLSFAQLREAHVVLTTKSMLVSAYKKCSDERVNLVDSYCWQLAHDVTDTENAHAKIARLNRFRPSYMRTGKAVSKTTTTSPSSSSTSLPSGNRVETSGDEDNGDGKDFDAKLHLDLPEEKLRRRENVHFSSPWWRVFFSHRWTRVVLDEAHLFRNKNTSLFRAASQLRARSRILCTATPVNNNISDLESLLRVAHLAPPGGWKNLYGKNQQGLRTIETEPIQELCKRYMITDQDVEDADEPEENESRPLFARAEEVLLAQPQSSVLIETTSSGRVNLRPLSSGHDQYRQVHIVYRAEFDNSLERRVYDRTLSKYMQSANPETQTGWKHTTASLDTRSSGNVLAVILKLRKICDGAATFHDADEERLSTSLVDTGATTDYCTQTTPSAVHLSNSLPFSSSSSSSSSYTTTALPSTKLRMVQAYVRDVVIPRGEKAVAFVWFRSASSQLEVLLRDINRQRHEAATVHTANNTGSRAGLRPMTAAVLGVFVINGSTPAPERVRIRTLFSRHQGPAVLIATVLTFNLGVNLPAANHVLRIYSWWNPVFASQASGRVRRPSQQRSVFLVDFLLTNTVDDSIWAVGLRKQKLIRATLQGELSEEDGQLITTRTAITDTLEHTSRTLENTASGESEHLSRRDRRSMVAVSSRSLTPRRSVSVIEDIEEEVTEATFDDKLAESDSSSSVDVPRLPKQLLTAVLSGRAMDILDPDHLPRSQALQQAAAATGGSDESSTLFHPTRDESKHLETVIRATCDLMFSTVRAESVPETVLLTPPTGIGIGGRLPSQASSLQTSAPSTNRPCSEANTAKLRRQRATLVSTSQVAGRARPSIQQPQRHRYTHAIKQPRLHVTERQRDAPRSLPTKVSSSSPSGQPTYRIIAGMRVRIHEEQASAGSRRSVVVPPEQRRREKRKMVMISLDQIPSSAVERQHTTRRVLPRTDNDTTSSVRHQNTSKGALMATRDIIDMFRTYQ